MNVEDLIKVARTDYLNEYTESFVSNNDIMIRSLNEAVRQACNRTNFLFDDSTASITEITLVDGTASYELSSKVTYIEHVIFEGKSVAHKSKSELNNLRPLWRTETGMTDKVISYVMRGRTIRFIPSPVTADDGLKVNLEVFRLPLVDMALITDTPVIPEENHRDLVYWPIYEAYSRNNEGQDLNKANYYLDKFTDVFGEYVPSEVRINQFEQPKSLHLHPTRYTTNLTRESGDDTWTTEW